MTAPELTVGDVVWRRAQTGRLRVMAHAVVVEPTPSNGTPRLHRSSLCGFAPKRSWSTLVVRHYDETCPRCATIINRNNEPKEK